MPRDDLSIDFVKNMAPTGEALDPSVVLDDWMNRAANLPEEIRFMQDEIAVKDRQYNECIKIIEERDGRIQKFIKTNGSHETNSREEAHRRIIAENFAKAERLADEKCELANRMQATMDRHLRQFDMQIKQLYDRNEAGFNDPDEVPSLLRASAANQTAPSVRASMASSSSRPSALNGTKASSPVSPAIASSGGNNNGAGGGNGRGSNHAQVRQTQAQQGHSASAPASPAASMILNRQTREGSAGPTPKRGPRGNIGLGNTPTTSSGLARHSSLGPGTPKSHHQTAAGAQRAGSAGPRTTTKGTGAGSGRKSGTPSTSSALAAAAAGVASTGPGRKKGNNGSATPTLKTSLSRVKRPSKNSAASSTAESELSEAESASESNASSRRGTPARGSGTQGGSGSGLGGNSGGNSGGSGGNGDKESSSGPKVKREKDSSEGISAGAGTAGGASGGASNGPRGYHGHHHHHTAATKHGPSRGGVHPSSDDRMDLDDEEAGDDRKYCLCQNVSFGDMVACDNEDCPYEWFHWSCVGLKSEPNGTWYCPVCTKKMNGGGDPDVDVTKLALTAVAGRSGGSGGSNTGSSASNTGNNGAAGAGGVTSGTGVGASGAGTASTGAGSIGASGTNGAGGNGPGSSASTPTTTRKGK